MWRRLWLLHGRQLINSERHSINRDHKESELILRRRSFAAAHADKIRATLEARLKSPLSSIPLSGGKSKWCALERCKYPSGYRSLLCRMQPQAPTGCLGWHSNRLRKSGAFPKRLIVMNRTILQSGDTVAPQRARLTYTVKEACLIIGISRTTLWRAIRKGRLGCYRVGRRVLLSEEHMTGFLKLHEKGSRNYSLR